MHQTFWFRVSAPKGGVADALKEEALGTLEEYMNHYGDENNWFQAEMLLLEDGTVTQLCDSDDWRGRDSLAEHYLSLPPDKRWAAAIKAATTSVALELGIGGGSAFWIGEPDESTRAVLEMPAEQLMERIHREAPVHLARMYQDLAEERVKDKWPGEQAYLRRKRTRIFEMFLAADFKPFAERATPYDYPCYDLTEDSGDARQVALLAVDIHT